MSFAENLARLPAADGIAAIVLEDPAGGIERIENVPGSQGSVRVYAYLAGKHESLDAVAAEEGLALYAEHTADARANPGKHPNIDRLITIADGTGAPRRARRVPLSAA
jgi:hypothetical protein